MLKPIVRMLVVAIVVIVLFRVALMMGRRTAFEKSRQRAFAARDSLENPDLSRFPVSNTPRTAQQQRDSVVSAVAREVLRVTALELQYEKANGAFALHGELLPGFFPRPGMLYFFTPDTGRTYDQPHAARIEVAVFHPGVGVTCKPESSGADHASVPPGDIGDLRAACTDGPSADAISEVLPPRDYEKFYRR